MVTAPAEVPERLTPTRDTLRELYLRSGNVCAYPGCTHRIIDEVGNFVAHVCHIEAAMPGGERFNPASTNEERRLPANLLLMCYAHHVATNDVVAFPVERMRAIKAAHEAKFSGAVDRIVDAFEDETKARPMTAPRTIARLDAVMRWNHGEEERAGTAASLLGLARRLEPLPISTRELLAIIIDRATTSRSGEGTATVLFSDIRRACKLEEETLLEHVEILEHHGVGYLDDSRDGASPWIHIRPPEELWPAWDALRTFCRETGTPLTRLIVDLRFDLLDG